MGGQPWAMTASGLLLTVRLTPKGRHDTIDGVEQIADGRVVLKVRVRALASQGDANAALTRLIARRLGVAARSVTLVAGKTARIKRIRIDGDGAALAATLQKIASTAA